MLRRDTTLKVRDVFLPEYEILEQSSGFETLKEEEEERRGKKSYKQHLLF